MELLRAVAASCRDLEKIRTQLLARYSAAEGTLDGDSHLCTDLPSVLRLVDGNLREPDEDGQLGLRPGDLDCPLDVGLLAHERKITFVMVMSTTKVIETGNNSGYMLRRMVNPGDRIREAREKRGWSQAQLAGRVGISQAAVSKAEKGDTRQSKFLPQIYSALDLDISELATPPNVNYEQPTVLERDKLMSRVADFPVYPSVEGGSGEIIRMPAAMEWRLRPQPAEHVPEAYGVYVVGTSMVPEYRPGDVALVNPRLPLIADEVYIFYTEEIHGEARATIKHLRKVTAKEYHVTQHNPPPGQPKDFTLSRSEWTCAHRVIGKYSRQ